MSGNILPTTDESGGVQRSRVYGPSGLYRVPSPLADAIVQGKDAGAVFAVCCLATICGTSLYGAVFGAWRSSDQMLYSALKMPILVLSVTFLSGVLNAMLAQALGARITIRQSMQCMLFGFGVASILLGALSPVMWFFSVQMPAPGERGDMLAYRLLLPAHVVVIAFCGTWGINHTQRLLIRITASEIIAKRVLRYWFLVSGILGTQLSWLISPFLARPDLPVPFLNPNAWSGNFFEYLWRSSVNLLN